MLLDFSAINLKQQCKIMYNSSKICNKLIWLVEKQWDLKSTNQLKAVLKWYFDALWKN